jgi:PemK-like, MazF-like toxin of type II toxin-antitoxin system
VSGTPKGFAPPKPGDIVWCRFPQDRTLRPGPKPRPALVVKVGFIGEETAVTVAFGTSQKVDNLFAGEFAITPADGAAYRASGLSYPTKFNFAQQVELPYNDRWFDAPPGMPFGPQPKLGVLHPSLVKRAEAAFRAVR